MTKDVVLPVASLAADFNSEFLIRWELMKPLYTGLIFSTTLKDLVRYPERTSTSILRADILTTSTDASKTASSLLPDPSQWSFDKCIERKLLAKNPQRDEEMLQDCCFYHRNVERTGDTCNLSASLVILEPRKKDRIPFYHPQVAAIALYHSEEKVQISFVPLLDGTNVHARTEVQNRNNRTLLHLLSIVHKHSTGTFSNYKKRVNHDLVVGKEDWQDSYVELKRKYAKEYIEKWVEETDPKKHVFEDLGITAFLINLWKQTSCVVPCRFVDVGCGNGLLVDLLRREGWHGYGFDARHRKSWAMYNELTDLREMVICPSFLEDSEQPHEETNNPGCTAVKPNSIEIHQGVFSGDEFLIGNHADELTPYIPLLSASASLRELPTIESSDGQTVISRAGFIIIPCCTFAFDGQKHQGLSTVGGRYASYIKFLESVCRDVGWEVEREALRIPSTRNIALIGRRRRCVENSRGLRGATQSERLEHLCRAVVAKHHGAAGFLDRARSLTSTKPRSH